MGLEEKIFKEKIHFYYMIYMVKLLHKNPWPGGHEIYNFGRPFLGHYNYIISLSKPCPMQYREDFLGNTSILQVLPPKLPPLGVGGH